MKTICFSGLVMLSAAAVAAAPVVIFADAFDQPTEITYLFPPAAGTSVQYHGKFSAWTKEGLLSLTYGQGLGTKGSGGMLLTVDKVSEQFMFAAQNELVLPISDPASATVEQVKTYVLSFDAKIPAGHRIEVSIDPKVSDVALRARAGASRLVFPTLIGTGEYKTYTLRVADLSDGGVGLFLQFFRDASLKAQTTLLVDIKWTLLGRSQTWAAGDTVQFDNIKLTSGL